MRKQNKRIITRMAGDKAAADLNALQYMELASTKDLDQFDLALHNIARYLFLLLLLLYHRLSFTTPSFVNHSIAVRYISLMENNKHTNATQLMAEVHKNWESQNAELVLKRKQLKHVPPIISYLHHLQKLRLSNNLIRYFPKELKHLAHLMELDLSCNLIDELPGDTLLTFPSLIKLDLEYNKLENLPMDEIKKMKKLQELKTRGNPLSSLPSRYRRKHNILEFKPAPPKSSSFFSLSFSSFPLSFFPLPLSFFFPSFFLPSFPPSILSSLPLSLSPSFAH